MTFFKNIMKVKTLILVIGFAATIEAISYNVIAEPPLNTIVAVIVDGAVFPLKPEYGILYKGEAPLAKVGYNYAFVDSANTKISEPFQRRLLLDDNSSSTLNEFFNRSSNTYNVKSLPQVMPPLESIHRIKSDLHILNQIPTIHIYGDQSEIDSLHTNQLEDVNYKLNVAYIGLKDVQVFNDVKVSLAGSNTRKFSKLSYGLKLDKKSDLTLFGYKNLKLRSLVRDPSYIREIVCHHVLESSGLPASGFSYVRLFINNQAIGLFGLVETFQDPWTAAVFANGDTNYQSGYMYEGYGGNMRKDPNAVEIPVSDLHYEPDVKKYSLGQYKVKTGPNKKEAESFQGLQDFTKFINESLVGNTTQDEWETRIDVNGFLRVIALDDLLGFSDSYLGLANNYYLYEDPEQNGRIIFIPADLDTTLGRTFFNISVYTNGNLNEHPNLFFRPLSKAVLANSEYLHYLKSVHFALAKNLVNSEVLNPYIDSIVEMIRTDVEWDSKLKRVGKSLFKPIPDGKDMAGLLELFKKYTEPGVIYEFERDKQIVAPLDVAVGGKYVTNSSLSVKDYIFQKSLAVLQYYNK